MPTSHLPYQPTQDLLLPPSLRDWWPKDHLARSVSDTIEGLDLIASYRRREGGGSRNRPCCTAMMVKVQVCAHATGLFVQVGKLARRKQRSVAIRTAKLQTAEGRAKYRRREMIVEPPNGWLKRVLGFQRFSLRGTEQVHSDFELVRAALNLRRMVVMMA